MNFFIKNKSILSTILIFLLLIVICFISEHDYNKLNRVRLFNKQLNEKYKANNIELSRIVNLYFSKKNKQEFNLNKQEAVFIFSDTNLIYWNNNEINLFYSDLISLQNQRILVTKSGYYQVSKREIKNFTFVICDLIKNKYKFQNDYLIESYNNYYLIDNSFEISLTKTDFPIYDENKSILFFIKPPKIPDNSEIHLLISIVFLLLVISFIITFYRLLKHNLKHINGSVKVIIFLIVVILLRFVQFVFKFPNQLYDTELFSPLIFAYSQLLPSLGDLFINVILLFTLSIVFTKTFNKKLLKPKTKSQKIILLLLLSLIINLLFLLAIYIVKIVTINSTFSLNLSYLSALNIYSLVGILIILLSVLSYAIISLRIVLILSSYYCNKNLIIAYIIVAAVFYFAISGILHFEMPLIYLIFNVIIFLSLVNIGDYQKEISLPKLIITILLLSFITSYTLQTYLNKKDQNERKLIALRLSIEHDKIAEYLFLKIQNNMQTDSVLIEKVENAIQKQSLENECINYIKNKYFTGYWEKYNLNITLCFNDKQLEINPSNKIVNCNKYFDEIINLFGEQSDCDDLFYIKSAYGISNYIGIIPLEVENIKQPNIIVEFMAKSAYKGLGYPELLLDKSLIKTINHGDYSYAVYKKGELVKSFGNYTYGIKFNFDFNNDYSIKDKNGYNHVIHRTSSGVDIVISKQNEHFSQLISSYTYIFIDFILLIFILIAFAYKTVFNDIKFSDIKIRLLLTIFIIIISSSLAIGFITFKSIKAIYVNKSEKILIEKALSVLTEMEHDFFKLSNDINNKNKINIESMLINYSLIFFSDINLYDSDGNLIASSRPQFFDEGLGSTLINRDAYKQLLIDKETYFITNEIKGNYRYLSVYLAYRDSNNNLIAFVNLPYFARQQEVQKELSSFIGSFVNIIILITAFAVFIALLLANYIAKPLQLIRNRFAKINLSNNNEKINYKGYDEIGDLVKEYNNMIDKLQESAIKLAKSEREGAWQLMARQVAHEIKNPLTPIKLSIQHLQRIFENEQIKDKEKLNKTLQNIIYQIDSLAEIASTFSDFARMPKQNISKINLINVIKEVVLIYENNKNITININADDNNYLINADGKQLTRVFINLINNSIQAVSENKKGIINIKLSKDKNYYCINFTDNGKGIKESEKIKIFSPNFTTKSSGMGLGLAIVKNIINSYDGFISFESNENKGTTFYIYLPIINNMKKYEQ